MVIIIKHIAIEGPGIILEVLKRENISYHIIELNRKEKLPLPITEEIKVVISLGGPMNVNEEDKYPFLKEEKIFLREIVKREIPFLGICLGAQLLASAFGARVYKNKEKEIGMYKVTLTERGREEAIFKGVDNNSFMFQWHEDTFDLPQNAILLAEGKTCYNQCFRLGKNAYGFQFHPEITETMLKDWLDYYKEDIDREKIISSFLKNKSTYQKNSQQIFNNFFSNLFS